MERLQRLKPVLAGLLAALALVLVIQNQQPVETRVFFWQLAMPRFALLAAVYLLGVATGWGLHWRSRRGE